MNFCHCAFNQLKTRIEKKAHSSSTFCLTAFELGHWLLPAFGFSNCNISSFWVLRLLVFEAEFAPFVLPFVRASDSDWNGAVSSPGSQACSPVLKLLLRACETLKLCVSVPYNKTHSICMNILLLLFIWRTLTDREIQIKQALYVPQFSSLSFSVPFYSQCFIFQFPSSCP